MTTTTASTTFDAAALKAAIEGRDAPAVLALYADDAAIEMVDRENPPSTPQRVEGRGALRELFEDVYGRDLTHAVEPVVVEGDHVAYVVRCRYGDGTRVVCMAVAQLRDGRIARETVLQAWDA
jgi:ketosteroid isomerase-like protein